MDRAQLTEHVCLHCKKPLPETSIVLTRFVRIQDPEGKEWEHFRWRREWCSKACQDLWEAIEKEVSGQLALKGGME